MCSVVGDWGGGGGSETDSALTSVRPVSLPVCCLLFVLLTSSELGVFQALPQENGFLLSVDNAS